MNNAVGIILGITDESNPEWKYINHKGHVITCTKAQYISYFKKKKVLTHKQVMKKAIDSIFASCPMYKYLKEEEVSKWGLNLM